MACAGPAQKTPHLSATVSIDADAPKLQVFESHQDLKAGTGQFRTYRVDTVEDEPVTPTAPLTPSKAPYLEVFEGKSKGLYLSLTC